VDQVALTHVVWVEYLVARGILSNDLHRHTEQKWADRGIVQPMQVKHIEDVGKP
jgi:hypothetical protein